MLPLDGVKILDFSRVVAGPVCSQVLGDLGADVYKVEPIGLGDFSRSFHIAEPRNGESYSFLALNRNKKSICLDLRQPKGKDIALALVKSCDVVLHNFRPGVMERLGLDYESLKGHNAKVIYASISGFGPIGPYSKKPGQDLLAQAMGGVTWLSGTRNGPPIHSGAVIADYIAGMLLVQAILAALWARDKTGEGQEVMVSLLDGILHLQAEAATAYLNSGNPQRKNTRPINRFYRTKDDRWIALAGTFGQHPIRDVCVALNLPDLSQDERFDTWEKANYTNADLLESIFAERFCTRTRDEWLSVLDENGILCAPVNTYEEAFSDPQVLQNEMVIEFDHPRAGKVVSIGLPLKFSRASGKVRLPPPLLGEHTEEILTMLGYSSEDIRGLRASNVVD